MATKTAAYRRELPGRVIALTLMLLIARSASGGIDFASIRDYRRAHEREILAEYTRLLAIPNVASDAPNIRRNAQFIVQMMQRRGLNPRLLETKTKDTPPVVYGEWKVPGATRSIILYAHYDGQPLKIIRDFRSA